MADVGFAVIEEAGVSGLSRCLPQRRAEVEKFEYCKYLKDGIGEKRLCS